MSFQFLPEYRDRIKWFDLSPDAGGPTCICSLCDQLIGEDEVSIRAFDTDRDLEARFHLKCFGIVTGTEIYALLDDQEYYGQQEGEESVPEQRTAEEQEIQKVATRILRQQRQARWN